MLVDHLFLVKAGNFTEACQRIEHFLEKYQLVSYESVSFEAQGLQPHEASFWERLEEGLSKNRSFVVENLVLLQEEGFEEVRDLKDLPQGYLSKQLHIVVHFLDGFFGIDSHFYNLVEDSHWVSRSLYRKLKDSPSDFWLVKTRASSIMEGPLFEKIKHPA
ncbi:MAG: hypothetical protein GXO20_04785 [Thermodesulfobacteria bacterium]|nr:hypothetical protein [Thermodesulfobacteriota bacterium]